MTDKSSKPLADVPTKTTPAPSKPAAAPAAASPSAKPTAKPVAKACTCGTLQTKALALAVAETNVTEVGNNSGKRVNEYQKAAKTYDGAPWCAAFVNWCAENAAMECGCLSPLEAVPNQALVQSYVDHFQKQGKTHTSLKQAKPGQLFCVFFPSLKRYGHVGFVRGVDLAKGTFRTQEGNSNDDGSREGTKVCSNNRVFTGRILFIDW